MAVSRSVEVLSAVEQHWEMSLIGRTAAVLRDTLRVAIVLLFLFMFGQHVVRYLREPILTRVRRYNMPAPNITLCPSDMENYSVEKDKREAWRWAIGRQTTQSLIASHIVAVTVNMSLCVGGAGVHPYSCGVSARGFGQWHSHVTPPGLVCHTLIIARQWRDTMRMKLWLDGRQMWPDNSSILLLHTGEKPPIQPGQFTNSMAILQMRSGFHVTSAITFREFRRTFTRRIPCVHDIRYKYDKCILDCRWRKAAETEGCRGSWQSSLDLPVCSSKTDVINLHQTFKSITVHQCHCHHPCLHRDYFLVDRVNVTGLPGDTNSSLKMQFANHHLQVQEFLGYNGEDLLADVGGNIGLLLGLSTLTIIAIMEDAVLLLMRRYRGGNTRVSPVLHSAMNQLKRGSVSGNVHHHDPPHTSNIHHHDPPYTSNVHHHDPTHTGSIHHHQ